MEELRKTLFNLAVLYGLRSCYSTLDSIRDEVRAHGQFLVSEYDVAVEAETKVMPVEMSTILEDEIKTEKVVKTDEEVKTEKVVKKERKSRKKEAQVTNENDTQPLNVVMENKPIVCNNEEVETKELVNEIKPFKGNTKKRWQRSQEALKRLELESRGIFKQDILTIENVSAWIKGGKSYALIAREEVGCTEEEVSKFCKKHNIKA